MGLLLKALGKTPSAGFPYARDGVLPLNGVPGPPRSRGRSRAPGCLNRGKCSLAFPAITRLSRAPPGISTRGKCLRPAIPSPGHPFRSSWLAAPPSSYSPYISNCMYIMKLFWYLLWNKRPKKSQKKKKKTQEALYIEMSKRVLAGQADPNSATGKMQESAPTAEDSKILKVSTSAHRGSRAIPPKNVTGSCRYGTPRA